MPKIVDHEARRADIAAALRRVIQREGMAGTSVRTVATEAGLSTGAMRHYFATQAQLLGFALEAISSDVERRITHRMAGWGERPGVDALVAFLEEFVPLDSTRRVEFEVWLELLMLARTTPQLRPIVLEAHRGLHEVCRLIVAAARGQREAAVPVRLVDELHGLLDGLALHLALYPAQTSRARVRAALRSHLEAVAAETAP